jgi:hypothetical protein
MVWHPFVNNSNLKDKFLLVQLLSAVMVDDINQEIGHDQKPTISPPLAACAAKDCYKRSHEICLTATKGSALVNRNQY